MGKLPLGLFSPIFFLALAAVGIATGFHLNGH